MEDELWRSLAIVRPVSLRPQGEGQKNAHGLKGCTRSLWPRIFFDLSFRCKGILNGFASVTACGCWGSDCPVICSYLAYIYCPKESKCYALARFTLIRSISVRKNIRVYINKLNTNLPNQTNHLICRQNQKTNPSQIPFVPSGHNPNQKKIKI